MLMRFPDASEALLEARRLQRRVDTKFVASDAQLPSVVSALEGSHALLRSAGRPSATYETLYFDTPERRFFRMHQRGERPRHKVRIRRYVERGLETMEIKTKVPSGRTEKLRRVREGLMELDTSERALAASSTGVDSACLERSARTDFRRITLLALDEEERLTIDTELRFRVEARTLEMRGLMIVELKQARFNARSRAFLALRALSIRPASFSKYCAALASLCDPPKSSQLRARLRRLPAELVQG